MANARMILTVVCALCSGLISVQAQETPEFPQPQKEHALLKQFLGEWITQGEAIMGPGQPAMKCQGRIRSRMLGEFWVLSEVESEGMGHQVNALQTIGYDSQQKMYVGTWVDSMINYLWRYEGRVEGKTLILEATGPNFFSNGKATKFQDIYEFKSADEILTTSKMQGDDGKWVTFMTGTAKRKPARQK